MCLPPAPAVPDRILPVSYTHLDVYKRQGSFISVDKLEKAVIDELNKLSAEYLDKDELEQNVQFNNDLRGQKEARETEDVYKRQA